MNGAVDKNSTLKSELRNTIELHHETTSKLNGQESREVFGAKFLFSLYEIVFEYSEPDSESPGKQSDIIENFTCAYENLGVSPEKLYNILSETSDLH